jgi:hypothetical protein
MVATRIVGKTHYNITGSMIGGLSDDKLIADYEAEIQGEPLPYGQGQGDTKKEWDPVHVGWVADIIKYVEGSFVRAGEILVGALLIGVAVNAMLKGQGPR